MEKIYCACGCGTELLFSKGRKKKKFIHGHHSRLKNSGAAARKGNEPWNKGRPRTEEEKKKISNSQKKSYKSKNRKTYIKTEEHKQNLIESAKKQKSKEHIEKIIDSRKNGPKYEEWKNKISESLKQKYENGDLISSFYIDGRYINDPNSQYNLYNGEFTDELKFEIRKRDNWTCQMCSKKRSTTVHHINEDKTCNASNNLIVLCRSCHAKYHFQLNDEDKKKQTEIFLKLITERN
jgi:hypothetical protein